MNVISSRATAWWSGLADRQRRVASGLVLIGLLYTAHYLIYCIPQPFYIEDAAISFAYARNLVDGSGCTPRRRPARRGTQSVLALGRRPVCARLPPSPPQRCWAGSSGWRRFRWPGADTSGTAGSGRHPFHPDFMALIAPSAWR